MKFSPDGEFFATAGKVNFENIVAKLCICTTLYFNTVCTPALVCMCVVLIQACAHRVEVSSIFPDQCSPYYLLNLNLSVS